MGDKDDEDKEDKEEGTIKVNVGKIFPNQQSKIFFILFFLSLLIGILRFLGVGLGISFFSSMLLWTLVLALTISTICAYFGKFKLMFLPIIIWLLLTTAVVRISNIPGLKDITTGDWTLAPDLDPFLYLRLAGDINNRSLQNPDMMRYFPLGATNYAYQSLMPWFIFGFYKITQILGNDSLTYAAIILPVILFGISVIGFLLFIKVLSSLKFSEEKSWLFALVASVFYIFMPAMLHRTVAGVPEIESLGMAWFWFAFLFITLAWKERRKKKFILYGALAGIFTGLMSWSWGGYRYIYMIFGLFALLMFLFQKDEIKNRVIFTSWAIPALAIFFFQVRSLKFLTTNISDTGFGLFVLFLLWVNFILFNTKLKEKIKLDKINLPKPITSSIIGVLLLLLGLLIVNSSFVIGSINSIFERMLYPFGRARVGLTVAENAVPYFLEIVQNFGYLLWIFIIGIIAIFYEMIKHFTPNKSEKTIVNIIIGFLIISFIYIMFQIIFSKNYYNSGTVRGNVDYLIIFNLFLFLIGIIYSVIKNKTFLLLNSAFLFMLVSSLFSRFSGYAGVILNGVNSFSRFLYLTGMILFLFILFYIFIKAHIKKNEKILQDFRDINFIYVLMLAFTFWEIVSMRGAIRLLFIVSPVIPLISSFLFVKILDYKDKNKENKSKKLASFVALSILIIIMLVTFVNYSAGTIGSVNASVPGVYEQQWQKAMAWVRENTLLDSVFVHWWDYGYWVQTIGKRPTVADGGHFIGYWPHLIGRYVLTTYYPETALSFMKSHNVSYLLIDSTDLGKYGAYSSIGSDETGKDRLSQVPVMVMDPAQTQETAESEIRVYQGGALVDGDIIYDGGKIFLPADKAVIAATMVEFSKKNNQFSFNRSYGIFIYNNQQINIPVRYIYFRGKMIDLGGGLDAVIMLIPSASSTGQNIQFDDLGAVIYLSPKVSRGLFAQLYLMNDPFNIYPTIKLAHSEPDFLISNLNSQGAGIGDFLYFNGFRGPIKIWKVDYPDNIIAREEFLRTTGGYGEFDNLTFTE